MNSDLKELIIVGAGGFGRELLQWAKEINALNPLWNIRGFLDDIKVIPENGCSHSIIGTIKDWSPQPNQIFACAVGDPRSKEKVVTLLKSRGAVFENIIHPTAIIGENNLIGEGLIMYPNARITVNCTIGSFVSILSAAIGHDVHIGDFSTISSFSTITGDVHLGRRVFVGSNATIIPHLRIGDDVYMGAGSVVVNNLKEGARVMGNPARSFVPVTQNDNF